MGGREGQGGSGRVLRGCNLVGGVRSHSVAARFFHNKASPVLRCLFT